MRAVKIFFILLLCCWGAPTWSAPKLVEITSLEHPMRIGGYLEWLEDKTNSLSPAQAILTTGYISCKLDVPNLPVSPNTFWVRITLSNLTASNDLEMNIDYPTIDSLSLFMVNDSGNMSLLSSTGEYVPYYTRKHHHQAYIFNLNLPAGTTHTYYVKLRASEPLQLPITIGTPSRIADELFNKDLLFGLYAGIILVMFLYNLFLFFTVRDRSYLYYVGYMIFTGLTQACLEGYATRLFYPNNAYLANAMVVWIPAFSGIMSIVFINYFLQVKSYAPVLYKILVGFIVVYFGIIGISFTGNLLVSTQIMQLLVTLLAVVVYITAIKISRRGYRPAKIFLLAWTIFIVSVVVFVMRAQGVLPYNIFTLYAMEIGSAIEVVLLSFALADKINTFRKEKEVSQAQAIAASLENERIVREQNVMLERKVQERTNELQISNEDLNKAMKELKDAEIQLVESEKMASLGQLTAGIAHEINNPINFVTSNVSPLNRDVQILLETVEMIEGIVLQHIPEQHKQVVNYKREMDYDYLKLEIEQLLKGIGEGAARTAEIVKGLRIFSRLDEDDLKRADVNEGLVSTLVITNNLLNNHIVVDAQYGQLPLIECFPGKLNQVFLNMISNAVYAIKKKFGDEHGGILSIKTFKEGDEVHIHIGDNGTGMDALTMKRIFEPFFTTKDVGEGTGLGLSIAYNTIKKHNGTVHISSNLGEGTTFKISLPLLQK